MYFKTAATIFMLLLAALCLYGTHVIGGLADGSLGCAVQTMFQMLTSSRSSYANKPAPAECSNPYAQTQASGIMLVVLLLIFAYKIYDGG